MMILNSLEDLASITKNGNEIIETKKSHYANKFKLDDTYYNQIKEKIDQKILMSKEIKIHRKPTNEVQYHKKLDLYSHDEIVNKSNRNVSELKCVNSITFLSKEETVDDKMVNKVIGNDKRVNFESINHKYINNMFNNFSEKSANGCFFRIKKLGPH